MISLSLILLFIDHNTQVERAPPKAACRL